MPATATTRQLYLATASSRLAERVLVRIGAFPARSFAELERRAADVDWDAWRRPGDTVTIRVTSRRSRLYHSAAIAERLHRVAGPPPPTADAAEPESVPFVVRVDRDRVTIHADAGGEPLHRRGWRQETAKAPLRETLAAALLAAAGWDGGVPLVDPFCGSGTIVIEAATIARRLAPGRGRNFAFQQWPSFAPGTWASVTGALAAAERPSPAGVALVGHDRDAGAVAAAAANAERAGVAGDVAFSRQALSDLLAPTGTESAPGWVITNPPYGQRVGGGDLRDLFARLGQVVRAELPGWSVGVLVADPRPAAAAGLPWQEALRTTNGGIDVRFLTADVPGRAPG